MTRPRRLRLHPHRGTTAHLCSAYPFHISAGTGGTGTLLGVDLLAGGAPFAYDPFDAYARGLVTNPNMLIAGEPGVGKSALIKTFVARTAAVFGRWVAIADPKGEYAPLAATLGLTVIDLHPGGATRINPLDTTHHGTTSGGGGEAGRHAATVAALCTTTLRRDLTPLEDATLGWAATILARQPGATLADLARLLANPTGELAGHAKVPADRLALGVEDLVFGLGKLLDRSLRGMFDGPSTVTLDPAGPGVVIDLSAVHHDPDALALVMIAATSWLQGVLAQPGPPRLQILDEAWALLASERTARYLQACWKLGRSYGVANIAVVHRLSDLRAQADDGTATVKVTQGLLADTQTRVLFRQAADQIPDAQTLLGLTSAEAALVTRLTRGRALWHIGGHAAVAQHHIAPAETALVDTDARMNQ